MYTIATLSLLIISAISILTLRRKIRARLASSRLPSRIGHLDTNSVQDLRFILRVMIDVTWHPECNNFKGDSDVVVLWLKTNGLVVEKFNHFYPHNNAYFLNLMGIIKDRIDVLEGIADIDNSNEFDQEVFNAFVHSKSEHKIN